MQPLAHALDDGPTHQLVAGQGHEKSDHDAHGRHSIVWEASRPWRTHADRICLGSAVVPRLCQRANGSLGRRRALAGPTDRRCARPHPRRPLPPEAKNLDLVLINVIYHDVTYMNVDRDKMNKAIFSALKPGGAYVVIDSSAKEGTGTSDGQTLHRIDEQVVRTELERAGFKLQSEGDFLRNSQDARDWNSSPPAAAAANRRGTSDRFALKFVKP